VVALAGKSPRVREHIARAVDVFNGRPGHPDSFDRLDRLLAAQAYRPAHWRVAAEEINYRRFFDINELAAIRMEDNDVFELVHAYVFELIGRGAIDGLRIDHVDGLYDPGDYLQRLQARARAIRPDVYSEDRLLHVIAEKILGVGEELPRWPVAGTTGYDFLAHVNGLFVDERNETALNSVYEHFTRVRSRFRDLAYQGRELVLRVSMASELNVLAHALNRFSERSRYCRDFTLNSLTHVLREIIACFPVYRTYVNPREPVSERDREYIERATSEAKRRNRSRPAFVFDFVRDLLLKKADYIGEAEREEHLRFVGKFQQVTSPVTAKGIEDTALYIYNRLTSLNEVGAQPDRFGMSPDALHAWLADRSAKWPHGLSATSTHDTKRSEDVRARLNVLSELPGAWKQAISSWARINGRGRSVLDGQSYPSRNEEYFLYQTLVGSWPLAGMTPPEERQYSERIVAYMHKAMREAKMFTSWLNPSQPHEEAMAHFVEFVLAPENTAFRTEFVPFQQRIARYGLYNSLAQLALKIAAPGVPDFYQGTELWDFSLVDPDNRRPVDYERRRRLLQELRTAEERDGAASIAERLAAHLCDDRTKLFATSGLLQFRRSRVTLFQCGRYHPLAVEGSRREHLFAFGRTHGRERVVVVVPRLIATLLPDAGVQPLGERIWDDTRIELPADWPATYRHVLTQQCVRARIDGRDSTPSDRGRHPRHARKVLRAADAFQHFPIAFLEGR
jgi:(1->4)-alpha-D-glucan 1-alpha-D-glucosylmutase